MNRKRIVAVVAAAAVLIAGAVVLVSGAKPGSGAKAESYDVSKIARGSIESLVSSSGTLSVVSQVSVLAQMSGRLETVLVDYNDRVKKGQVLATINTDLLRLQAKIAQASVDKAEANYGLQALAVKNAEALYAKGLLSEYDLKTAQSTLAVDKAELSSARASFEEIETEINQYAIISSPIDGIVLDRAVSAGESVVGGSSSSSTSLFAIAEDLVKMQIEAEVDELDIGSIKAGQSVRFTVEADPGAAFSGTVKEIRLVPETTDNVVYYRVIILADNKSGTLMPGMTANVSFIEQKKDGILVVPSAAFRFTPTSIDAAAVKKALFIAGLGDMGPEEKAQAAARYDEERKAAAAAPAESAVAKTGGLSSLMSGGGRGGPGFGGPPPGMGSSSSGAKATAAAATAKKALWYVDESGALAAYLVETGLTDGSKTEIVGAEGLEGKSVILKIKVD